MSKSKSKKVVLPVTWAEECDDLAASAWDDAVEMITEKMCEASFSQVLAQNASNDREEELSEIIFERIFKRFAELAKAQYRYYIM